MKKIIKIGAVAAAAAILCIVALALFAKVLITPELVRNAVLPVAEKSLKREVQLNDISISLFSGIILHDIRIMERDSDETFISASRAVLRYRLFPLLFLQVVIDELRFEKPYIRVVRLPGGAFNFSDLIAADQSPDSGNNTAAAPASDTAAAPLPMSLTIATVRLDSGTLLLVDGAVNPVKPSQYQISKLNGQARSISLDESFPFEFSCRLGEASLSLEGRADIMNQSGNAKIEIDNLDAIAFLPYFAEQIPGRLTGLNVNLNADIAGNLDKIVSSGTLALRGINMTLDALADAPIREASLLFDFDISAGLNTSLLEVRSARFNYNGIIAEASGRIDNFDSDPRLALDLELPELAIPAVLTALPKELVDDVLALEPDGSVAVKARIEGPADRGTAVIKSADVRLKNIRAAAGGIRPGINGSLLLTGDRLTSEDLVIETAAGRANVDLSARDLFGTPVEINATITADELNLDKLLKNAPPPAPAPGKTTAAGPDGPAREVGPFDLPVRAKGTVKINRALYKGLAIDDFSLVYRLADNILTIEDMSGRTAGGTFSQKGRVDLGRKGLSYQSTLSIQGLQTDPVISAFIPKAAGTVFGHFNLDLDANGSGTLPDTLKKNLSCTSRIDLNDGRITASKLAQGLADFLSIDELRELTFSTFGGTIDIKQGMARIDTKMDGTDIRMAPKGVIGLDGALDLSLNAALSPALMNKIDKRGNISSYLSDKQGWNQIPLKVTGNFAQPRFNIDTVGFKKQAEEKVFDLLQQKLFDRDEEDTTQEEKESGSPEQASPETLQPEEQTEQDRKKESKKERKKRKAEQKKLLEDTLRGLFEP